MRTVPFKLGNEVRSLLDMQPNGIRERIRELRVPEKALEGFGQHLKRNTEEKKNEYLHLSESLKG